MNGLQILLVIGMRVTLPHSCIPSHPLFPHLSCGCKMKQVVVLFGKESFHVPSCVLRFSQSSKGEEGFYQQRGLTKTQTIPKLETTKGGRCTPFVFIFLRTSRIRHRCTLGKVQA
jgi:hypothetical protein